MLVLYSEKRFTIFEHIADAVFKIFHIYKVGKWTMAHYFATLNKENEKNDDENEILKNWEMK